MNNIVEFIFNENITENEICESHKQYTGPIKTLERVEKSNITFHKQYINSSHNSKICILNACQKKEKHQTQTRWLFIPNPNLT